MKITSIYTTLLVLLCMLAAPLGTQAQTEIVSQHYTTDNGLPDNNIRCMEQDDNGFLWLGTLYGLYRFDGYSYRKFLKAAHGNRALMPTNRIKSISRMKDGRLLLYFNTNELVCYDIHHECFMPYSETAAYERMHQRRLRGEISDNLGNAVVYDGQGSITYHNKKTGKTLTMKVISDDMLRFKSDLKVHVITDHHGNVWVSTNGNGLFFHDIKTGTTRHITAQDAHPLLPSNNIVAMIIDRNGDVWVSNTWFGLTRMHIERTAFRTLQVSNDNIQEKREIKILSRLTTGEVIALNAKGEAVQIKDGRTMPFNELPAGIEYNGAGRMPDGTMWATTRSRGVWLNGKLHLDGERTDRLLVDSDGRVWVASINGLLAVQQKDGSFRRFFTKEKNFGIRHIYQDKFKRIWLGTSMGVVTFYPHELIKDEHCFQRYIISNSTGEYVRINCMLEDREHHMWVGTAGDGMYRSTNSLLSAANDGKPHTEILFEKMPADLLLNNSVQAIGADAKGNLWIGTESGYTYYNIRTRRPAYFRIDNNRLQNYCNGNCVAMTDDDGVAFGTLDGVVMTNAASIVHSHTAHKVIITDLAINGQALTDIDSELSPLKGMSVSDSRELSLHHDQNSIIIRFSDMLFQQPGGGTLTRYRYWMEGAENDWNEAQTTNTASYQDLKPGRYVFHVEAICDGTRSDECQLIIVISQPWWNTWWAYIIYLLAATAVAALLYRYLKEILQLRQSIHDERVLAAYRTKFFTNISHEFRTPLTLILASIDKMQQLAGQQTTLKSTMQTMKQNTERMKRLIDQLLEFRKMETGNLQLRVQETDASSFLYNIWQQFHDISERRRINYLFRQTKKQMPCWMDRAHIDKIVFNLLSNAFKYTPVGGEVTLLVKTEGEGTDERLIVQVLDSGIGVPEEKRENIFGRYSRSSVTTDSIGIGLNLSAELAQCHHGTLQYQPREEGGSIFTLTIPTGKAAYTADEMMSEEQKMLIAENSTEERKGFEEHVQEPISEPLNDRLILIVEDDLDIQEMLQQELSQYFHVETASDGQEAVEMLDERIPDLVITDYLMPRKDGFDLLQHIRKSSYRFLPVIMLTAIDTDKTRLKSARMGADAYITKPFNMQLLVAQAINLIRQRSYMMIDFGEPAATTTTPATTAPATIAAEAQRQTKSRVVAKQLQLPEIITEERDRKLIAQMDLYIDAHIGDTSLSVDTMAEALGYRRTNFYKKISSLIGCSPKEYVRQRRIMRAAEMLRDDKATVSEVAYKLGFSNPQYLSSVFKAHFGVKPSEYQKGHKTGQ